MQRLEIWETIFRIDEYVEVGPIIEVINWI